MLTRAALPLAALLALALPACSGDGRGDGGGGTTLPDDGLRAVEVASGLASPVHVATPPGDARLFVVEQPGRIRVIRDGQLRPTPFLDITDRVASGGERGLLSVAFHPRYDSNGFLYVNYTDRSGDTRIERYRASAADPDRADPASALLVLGVDQPYSNHNGGHVLFGPDGKLYVAMGDGGSGGDPQGHGQNAATLLGDILRLDVDGGTPYGIPADNPFVGQPGKRPEIWATGVRNPWRLAFDRDSGLLYVADVGQSRWEEVNVVRADRGGLNYGWSYMEGTHCYAPSSGCPTEGLVTPALEYTHDDGCSITGGVVYRGAAISSLRGHYLYSDYCQGWVRSFRWNGSAAVDGRSWTLGDLGNVTSFGEDSRGEVYLTSTNGRVYRLEPRP